MWILSSAKFLSQTLISGCFEAPWDMMIYSFSFETLKNGLIDFCLIKCVTALLRYEILARRTLINVELIQWPWRFFWSYLYKGAAILNKLNLTNEFNFNKAHYALERLWGGDKTLKYGFKIEYVGSSNFTGTSYLWHQVYMAWLCLTQHCLDGCENSIYVAFPELHSRGLWYF